MKLSLNYLDYSIMFIYLAAMLFIALYHWKKQQSSDDFLLAGRKLTLPVFVATLISTWYGGVLGVAEFVGGSGLGAWLVQGIIWYFVYFCFAFFCASKIQAAALYTIPDLLEQRYDKKTAVIASLFTFLMVNPAPYILSLGIVLQIFFDIDLTNAIILSTFLTVLYTILAGFWGVVYTDFVQCLWMYVGFVALAVFVFLQGNFSEVLAHLPKDHLKIHGGMELSTIIVWGGIACWVFVEPSFYQRCYAAKDGQVAKRGIYLAIAFWAIFDIITCSTAMYAFGLQKLNILTFSQPQMAHIALADYLMPSPLKGIFLVGIIATIMSSADSFLFAGAVNISRDLYWRVWQQNASDQQMVAATRLAVLFTAVLAMFMAIFVPSVVNLWYTIGSIGVSALIIPVWISFYPKLCNPTAAKVSVLVGGGVSSYWFLHSQLSSGSYPLGLEPLYPGVLASMITYFSLKATRS